MFSICYKIHQITIIEDTLDICIANYCRLAIILVSRNINVPKIYSSNMNCITQKNEICINHLIIRSLHNICGFNIAI